MSSRIPLLWFLVSLVACSHGPGSGDADVSFDARPDGADAPLDTGPELDADSSRSDADGDDAGRDCAAAEVLGAEPGETFDRWVAAIESVQYLSEDGLERLGTTWEAERERARRRFVSACSAAEAYWAMASLRNSTHDGHAWLELDAAPLVEGLAPVAAGVTVRVEYEEDGVHYVIVVGADPGVVEGREILAVDGVDVAQLERDHVEWFAMGSSPEGNREDLARWIGARDPFLEPTPAPGQPMTLTLADPASGEVADVTLLWRAAETTGRCPPFASPCDDDHPDYALRTPTFSGINLCTYATSEPDLAVVRLRSFYYPAPWDDWEVACLASRLDELSFPLDEAEVRSMESPLELMRLDRDALLDELRASGVTRVLIDVRENSGGSFDPELPAVFAVAPYSLPAKAFHFAPAFVDDPELIREADLWIGTADGQPASDAAGRIIDDLAANPGAEFSREFPFYCRSDACLVDEGTYAPVEAGLALSAVVLTGPRCFSSCDDFVSVMSANGIALLAGQPSGAGDSPFRFGVEVPSDGTTVVRHVVTVGISRHPGEDLPLEANPRPIDVPVVPSRANRGRYLDAVLQAVRWR